MLREYISNLLREINEQIADLMQEINANKEKRRETDQLIEALLSEVNSDVEIFSPRNHRSQNLEKIETLRAEQDKLSMNIQMQTGKMENLRKKKEEYLLMLSEIDGREEAEQKEMKGEKDSKEEKDTEEKEKKKTDEEENAKEEAKEDVKEEKDAEKEENRETASEELIRTKSIPQKEDGIILTDIDQDSREEQGEKKEKEAREETEEEPVAEESVAEESVAEESVAEESFTEESATEESDTEKSVREELVKGKLSEEKSSSKKSAAKETSEKESVGEKDVLNLSSDQKDEMEINITQLWNEISRRLGKARESGEETEQNLLPKQKQEDQETEQKTGEKAESTEESVETSTKTEKMDALSPDTSFGAKTIEVSSTSSVSDSKTETNDDIWNKLELINDDRNDRENIHEIEVKSGELIVLESERRKEKEFLGSVYKKIELCLASLNGDKNMCRNELRKIKKMIQEYVESLN